MQGQVEKSAFEDSDEEEDITIIENDEGNGDGWVVVSRNTTLASQEGTAVALRKQSNDSCHKDNISQSSPESSIEIIYSRESSPAKSHSTQESHSTVCSTTPAKSPGWDVERKFIAPPDYQQRLIKLGFVPVKQFRNEILDDCYYDFSTIHMTKQLETEDIAAMEKNQYLLLSHDHWLRKRNGDWELKYPINAKSPLPPNIDANTETSAAPRADAQCSQVIKYHETSSPDDIISKLKTVLPRIVKDGDTLNNLLLSGLLRPFAQLRTSRTCFKLHHTKTTSSPVDRNDTKYDVNVIVDMANWGCLIGEIEVTGEHKDEISIAAAEIDRLAILLDFKPLDLSYMLNCGASLQGRTEV